MSDLQRVFTEIIERTGASSSGGSGQYMGHCPAHQDKKPSLSIALKDGRILLKCHASCDISHIVNSLGIKMSDLFTTQINVKTPKSLSPEEEKKRENARLRAKKIWDSAEEAPSDHPYLVKKLFNHTE